MLWKNSEAKNCIGPEKPRVVVSANAVGWKWATVRATWPTRRNKREKKNVWWSRDGWGGAHVSKRCGWTGENMSLQMWHHSQTTVVVCCTLLCWGLLSNTDSCCELSLGSQFFPKGVFSWLIPNHDRRKCCLQIHQIIWTEHMQNKI